jgi:hypothetical protein
MKPLFTLALLALPAFAAFPNGYTYCKVVTTQHTMVSGTSDLTNYPLTVILIDNDLRTVGNAGLVNNANGYDIGFYPDCSGSGTALKWEMESYSPTTGAIVAHVLRPTLSHTADDTIGMFYGGSFSSFQSTATAVWDANYKGVWHLAQATAANVLDSTSNGVTGTPTASPVQSTGNIDGALSFNGSTQYVSDAFSSQPQGNQAVTMSAWVKFTNPASGIEIASFFGTDSASNKSGYYLYRNGAGKAVSEFGSGLGAATGTTTLASGTWYHLTGVYDGANSRIYVNGAQEAAPAFSTANFSGNRHFTAAYFNGVVPALFTDGLIDENRISNTARSAAWILTEYRNQSAPVTYLSAGPRITGDGGGSRVRHAVRGGV